MVKPIMVRQAHHEWLNLMAFEERVRVKPFTQLPHRIYLDDYQNLSTLTSAQTLLSLIVCQNQQTIEIAQKLVNQRTIHGIESLNFVETVLVYKLPHLTREEIKTMLGLDTELNQTRFYQEIAEEERQEGLNKGRKEESVALLTRQLRRKQGFAIAL